MGDEIPRLPPPLCGAWAWLCTCITILGIGAAGGCSSPGLDWVGWLFARALVVSEFVGSCWVTNSHEEKYTILRRTTEQSVSFG